MAHGVYTKLIAVDHYVREISKAATFSPRSSPPVPPLPVSIHTDVYAADRQGSSLQWTASAELNSNINL